ncbi:hypothetical protein [Tenacibaculum ovolyticum]|uniref:hypothetical protein n=1 Tax=Tenacibaculum ovolyticum TaxID=104270 RepID=UPI001F41A786|nr:hypothetical protein [Tenacibaculum ovolyticum]
MKLAFKFILKAVLILSILFLSSCKKKKEEPVKKTTKVAYNKLELESLCESDWFPHSQTPNPEEGIGSPFDTISTTNAIFHQWSWQKFLWLTKPVYQVEKLVVELDGKDVPLYIGETLPLFLNPQKMHQVNSSMQPVKQKEGAALVLIDTVQAGSAHGVLKTNPTYGENKKSETVFYSIYVDPIMKNAARKFRDSILKGTLPKDNLSSFPVGSLELKVSWVAKSAISKDKIKNYYTTVAAVSRDGKVFKNTEVALLGMHVVGVVENHPEFIWATFEHDDMAPNYNWKDNKATSSTNKLLFAEGTTTGINGIVWNKTTKEPVEKFRVFDLFEYGVPRDSVGGFMKTSQEEPINFKNITNINTCVKANLEKEAGPWKNYFYNGSIWIDTDGLNTNEQAKLLVKLGGDIGAATPESYARGSLNCANVTMETFTQTFKDSIQKIDVTNLANCFSCHNPISYSNDTSPIYLSHIFDAYMNAAEGKTSSEIEKMKAKQEVVEFIKNKLK